VRDVDDVGGRLPDHVRPVLGRRFWYFLPWLVGLGREYFDRVVADPDALADVPEVRRLAMLTMDRWTDDD